MQQNCSVHGRNTAERVPGVGTVLTPPGEPRTLQARAGQGRPEHTGRANEVEVLEEACQGHTRVEAYWEHLR